MPASAEKHPLTGASTGTLIKITGTATGSAVTIHTVPTNTSDEIWLWALNKHASTTYYLVVEWLGTGTDNEIRRDIEIFERGLQPVIPGLLVVTGGSTLTIEAYAEAANQIYVCGFVNRIENL